MYPNFLWEPSKFSSVLKKSSQRWLIVSLAQLFPPKTTIIEDYQNKDTNSGNLIEFDAFIPSYSLAFEYQGAQHYTDSHAFSNTTIIYSAMKDNIKQRYCFNSNITLICVPYWWDRSLEAISGIIKQIRPDIQLIPVVRPTSKLLDFDLEEPKVKFYIKNRIPGGFTRSLVESDKLIP